MPELSSEIIEMAQRCDVILPPNLPMYHSKPNYEHLREWVDSQATPKLREIAQKMVQNLHYVSFADFLAALNLIVTRFNQQIGSEPFIIVVAGSSKKAKEGCSDRWVPAIALQHTELNPPSNITTIAELPLALVSNPNIKNILLLDDATYSGAQMSETISSIINTLGGIQTLNTMYLNIHIAIPYYTKEAMDQISSKPPYLHKLQINFIGHQPMPTMLEIIGVENFEYLKKIGTQDIYPRQTLTYFDHRLADHWSIYQPIYTGEMVKFNTELLLNCIGCTFDPHNAKQKSLTYVTPDDVKKLLPNIYTHIHYGYNIPKVFKPYMLLERDYAELESAIKCGKVGIRSAYPITNTRISEIISMATPGALKPSASSPYFTSTLSLEQQRAFDQKYLEPEQQSAHSRLRP